MGQLILLAIGVALVAVIAYITRDQRCAREKQGYTCRRKYKNYCEGCQPAREAKL